MQLLTLEENFLIQNGAIFTAKEIKGQPELWNNITKLFIIAADDIESFLQAAYAEADSIILTGAGTSAFIGLSLSGVFFQQHKHYNKSRCNNRYCFTSA